MGFDGSGIAYCHELVGLLRNADIYKLGEMQISILVYFSGRNNFEAMSLKSE